MRPPVDRGGVETGAIGARRASPPGAGRARAGLCDERHRRDVAEMLQAAVLPGEPRWAEAARGDAASAIHFAIRAELVGEPRLAHFREIILIALWRCAVEGDVTAALALEWLGARVGQSREAGSRG